MAQHRFYFVLAAIALGVSLGLAPATAADDIISKIKDRGTLRACMAEDYPWNYTDPKENEWVGYNVDAVDNLATTLGVDLEVVDSNWQTVVQTLTTGQCDIAPLGFFPTPPRAEVMLFSAPIAYDTRTVFVSEDSTLATYSELDSPEQTVLVWTGSVDTEYAKRYFKHAEVREMPADNAAQLLLEVHNKRVDAFFGSTNLNLAILHANPQFQVRTIGDELLAETPMAYGIPKGEYQFQQYVNVWLDMMRREGTADEWYSKHFSD